MQRGVVSFFETPPGSLSSGFGLPRGDYLATLKSVGKTFKANAWHRTNEDILLNVVNDNYFHQIYDGASRSFLQEMEKKDATAKERRDQFKIAKESQELADAVRPGGWSIISRSSTQDPLPGPLCRAAQPVCRGRTPSSTAQALRESCFARAFDLADAKDPMRLDGQKVQAFAETWFAHMTERVFVETPGA